MSRVPTFPAEFNIGAQPDQAIPCYLRRTEHLPKNKTVARASKHTSDEINIELDTSTPGAFIDPQKSYLTFELELFLRNPSKQSLVQFGKCGVHGIVDEFVAECQGVPIEVIHQYGNLVSCLMDMYGVTGGSTGNIVRQMQGMPMQNTTHRFVMDNLRDNEPEYYGQRINHPDDRLYTMPQTLESTPESNDPTVGVSEDIRYDATWTDPNGKVHNLPYYAAGQLSSSTMKKVVVVYKIPLISGVLGTANRHLFPAFLIPAGALNLKFKLARIHECMTTMAGYNQWKDDAGYVLTDAGTVPAVDADDALDYYELRNIRFVAQQVVLSEDLASEVIRRATQNDIALMTTSWRHTSTYIRDAYQPDHQIVLQHKVASAKMTLYAFRHQEAIGKAGVLPYSRTSFGQTNDPSTSATWQLRIGNDLYPVKPAETSTDTLVEVEQAMQQWGDMRHETGLLTQYLHTNTHGYTSDFSNNLWRSELQWLEKVTGTGYPFAVMHTDNTPNATEQSLATYPFQNLDETKWEEEVKDDEVLYDGQQDTNDTTLFWNDLGWFEWDNGVGTYGKGWPSEPKQTLDLRQKEVLIVRMVRYIKDTGQRVPVSAGRNGNDYLQYQRTWSVADIGNGKSPLDFVDDINNDLADLKQNAQGTQSWWKGDPSGRSVVNLKFFDPGESGTSSSPTADGRTYLCFESNFAWGTQDGTIGFYPLVIMSPGLADCLGWKPKDNYTFESFGEYVYTNPYTNPKTFTAAGHIGADERRYPGYTIRWIRTPNTNPVQMHIDTLTVDNTADGAEHLRKPRQWSSAGKVAKGFLGAPYPLSEGAGARVRFRPLSCYSNALIAINHESFDDKGGTLRSGRLLGNNTLYLELKGSRFRRQFYVDYKNPAKPDNHLILYPTFADVAARGETPTEGSSVRMDSWVLHDLRVSIQSGGVMVSFY